MTSLDFVNPKFRNELTFFSKWSTNNSTNVSNLQMKWGQLCLGDFLTVKIPKNKRGLTSLHLATFLSEFYTCQNAAVL